MINVKLAIVFHYANQNSFTLQTRFYHLIDFLQNFNLYRISLAQLTRVSVLIRTHRGDY